MAYEPNFMDILTASTDEDARAKAQIMAEQLRGDKQLGMMGQLGGKRAAGMGKEMLADSDLAEKGLLTAGVNRLHYGTQAQDLKREKFSTDMLRAMAVQDAKNTASSERGDVLRQIAELRAGQTGAAAADKAGVKEEGDHYKRFLEFSNKNNPYQQSGRNPMGLRQNLLGQADRIGALVDSGNTNPEVVITSQLVREMEMGLAALGSSGSSGQIAKSAVDEIATKTMPRKYSEWKAWLTNEPQSAQAQAFVKQALLTIKREHDVLTKQLREGTARSAIAYRRSLFHPSNEADATAWLKDSGYDDDEISGIKSGQYKPTPRGRAAAAAPGVQAGERVFIVGGRRVAYGPGEQPPAGAVEEK